jgi:hypothetical protein
MDDDVLCVIFFYFHSFKKHFFTNTFFISELEYIVASILTSKCIVGRQG